MASTQRTAAAPTRSTDHFRVRWSQRRLSGTSVCFKRKPKSRGRRAFSTDVSGCVSRSSILANRYAGALTAAWCCGRRFILLRGCAGWARHCHGLPRLGRAGRIGTRGVVGGFAAATSCDGLGNACWIGYKMLRSPRRVFVFATGTGQPRGTPFATGALTNLLNPKVGIFYVSFLPQFVPPNVPIGPYILMLGAIHALAAIWFACLIAATRPIASWLRRPVVVQACDRLTGGVFVAFGMTFVWNLDALDRFLAVALAAGANNGSIVGCMNQPLPLELAAGARSQWRSGRVLGRLERDGGARGRHACNSAAPGDQDAAWASNGVDVRSAPCAWPTSALMVQ